MICAEEKLNNGKEEKSCHGKERGEELYLYAQERERERERERDLEKNEKRNKHLVLTISENGVLDFKQFVTEVKIMCKSCDINFCLT